jgi:hypothetical protein
VPLLTALTLLVMAAGLWFAGPAAASVPAPRLQVAQAQVAAAESAVDDEPRASADVPRPVAVAEAVLAAPVVGPVAAVAAAVVPTVAGPRAPPAG